MILFNVARAQDELGRARDAIQSYRRFLQEAPPDAPNRTVALERITILQAESQSAVPDDTGGSRQIEDGERDTSGHGEQIEAGGGGTPWIVLGVGAAFVAAGAIMIGVALADAASVTDAPDGSVWSDVQGSAERAEILWGVGLTAAGLGLAALVAGLSWGLLSGGGAADERSTRLEIGPGYLGVRGTF